MRSVLSIAAATASLLGCVEGSDLSEQTHAVQGGRETSRYAAAGYLHNVTTTNGCSATLVGERTVLTAAHCLNRSLTSTVIDLVDADDIHFYAVADATTLRTTDKRPAATLIPHPGFAGGTKHDIAVVILRDAPRASIARIPLATRAPVVGEEAFIIGHGPVELELRKRIATNTVDEVFETFHAFNGRGNVCDGDSGGASIARRNGQDVQIGVHSARSGACGRRGFDMRVDAYLPWIIEVTDGDVEIADDADPTDDDKADAPGADDESSAEAGCAAGAGRAGLLPLLIALAWTATRRSRRRR